MELLSPQLPGWIMVGVLLVWLTLGVRIGVALGLADFLGLFLAVGPDAALAQVSTVPFGATNSCTLAVIPLFILMGSFATVAALATDLFGAAYVSPQPASQPRHGDHHVLRHVRRRVGSTIVNAAVFARWRCRR